MNAHTGQVPETRRPTDWRDTAACTTTHPELFFAGGAEEAAKAVCRDCDVINQCLRFALDNGIDHGTFGGVTARDRRSLQRAISRSGLTPKEISERVRRARQPHQERTLWTIFEGQTTRLWGGHLAWTGGDQIHFQGRIYTPKQVAFILDRGRSPEGRVCIECGRDECVLPKHLTDQRERAEWRERAKEPAA